MSHPSVHARTRPDKIAVLMADSGERFSYAELDARSNRGAHLLRRAGLRPGDHVAVLMENHLRFFDVYWAAQRAGLYFTPIGTHLGADEATYIVNDCGAKLVVSSAALRETAGALPSRCPAVRHWYTTHGTIDGFAQWDAAASGLPATAIADEVGGHNMLYSSGTTGQPKGIKVPFAGNPVGTMVPVMKALAERFGYDADTVYLSPAPLYHAAPLGFCTAIQRLGGTVVVMERFDPERFLALIERHRVTHTQVVPTMFVRMLKLPDDVRARHDLSSLRGALHSAAPCPVAVKEGMIEWWGPRLFEYYSGSEGAGSTVIDSPEWLAHRGSVGRALTGEIRIVGEDGHALPVGETGTVYFAGGRRFAYHNDPAKTAGVFNAQGWSTLGDVGHLDAEGYLYLTDRKAYMIVSGGVNIYPQEAENLLTMHPAVADVAVFGVPDPEFGEAVKAVVQPVDMTRAGPALESALIAWCRERLAAYKCPRTIDFEARLPRTETGKLYKRLLRDRYWTGHPTRLL